MKYVLTWMTALSVLLCVPLQCYALTWQTVGQPIVSEAPMVNQSTELGSGGSVFASYGDQNGQYVLTYAMDSWNRLNEGLPLSNIRPSTATDGAGNLYTSGVIRGTDGFSLSNLAVKKYNGKRWSTVGKESFSPFYQMGNSCMAFDPQGTPYVLFTVGPDMPNPPSKPVNYNSGYFNINGHYGSVGNIQKLSLMKFNGAAWEQVGPPVFTEWYDARSLNMAFDKNGKLYVAFDEYNTDPGMDAYADAANTQKLFTYGTFKNRVSVMTYDPASGWSHLGAVFEDAEIGRYSTRQVVFALSPEGKPWVAFQGKSKYRDSEDGRYNRYDEKYTLHVKVFEDGVWKDTIRKDSIISATDNYSLHPLSVAFDWDGMPWLAYQYDITDRYGYKVLEKGKPGLKRCTMMNGVYEWTDIKPAGAEGLSDIAGLEIASDSSGNMVMAAYRNNVMDVWRAFEISDVPENAWYQEAVNYLIEKGVSSGTDSTHFSPDAKLTRGQLLTMVMRAYGLKPDPKLSENFADAGSTYYTGYLAKARSLGITKGVGKDTFAPDRVITRQEMLVLLYGVLQASGHLPAAADAKDLQGFRDADRVEPWARDAMTRFIASGTVYGYTDELRPFGTASRAELAQILYSLLRK